MVGGGTQGTRQPKWPHSEFDWETVSDCRFISLHERLSLVKKFTNRLPRFAPGVEV